MIRVAPSTMYDQSKAEIDLPAGRTRRPRYATVLMVVSLCLMTAATSELASRLIRSRRPDLIPALESGRVRAAQLWQFRPNNSGVFAGMPFSIDPSAFRHSPDEGPYDRTVLFLGDSFTFGYGVIDSDTLVVAAQRQLAKRGLPTRCLNAGVTGFGTAEELRLLYGLLKSQKVDAIVLQILPENDLEDNWEDGRFAWNGEKLIAFRTHHYPLAKRLRTALVEAATQLDSAAITIVANAILRLGWLHPTIGEYDYTLERELLRTFLQTATRHRIPIVFMVVPILRPIGYGPDLKFDRITAIVDELNAPRVDLSRIIHEREHYLPTDGHFSPLGNALVGEALAETLDPLLRR